MVPRVANGEELDTRLAQDHGLAVEYERAYSFAGHDGKMRIFVYRNTSDAGNYATTIGTTAFDLDITRSRKFGTAKDGAGINFEQEPSPDAGLFARGGWNDGKTETWAFTEIDRAASVGGTVKGRSWQRHDDAAGVALLLNSISHDHELYLSKGGC